MDYVFSQLTPTEKEVARRKIEGEQRDEICEGMGMKRRTLEWHIRKIRAKLGIEGIGTTEKELRRLYSESSYTNVD